MNKIITLVMITAATQQTLTYSKSTMEALEEGVMHVQILQ